MNRLNIEHVLIEEQWRFCQKCELLFPHMIFTQFLRIFFVYHDINYLNILLYLGKASEKKYGIIWEFFPNVGPPPPTPPFWEPLVQKKNYGLFCVLGPKEHFWFLQKCSLFVSILTYTFGNRGPHPLQGKNSQIIPFLPIFFPELTQNPITLK